MKVQVIVTIGAVCVLAFSASLVSTSLPCLNIGGVCHLKDTLQACSKGTTCESGKCRDPCSPIGGSCGHHSKPNCCGGSTCMSGTCQVPCIALGGSCGRHSKPNCCGGSTCI